MHILSPATHSCPSWISGGSVCVWGGGGEGGVHILSPATHSCPSWISGGSVCVGGCGGVFVCVCGGGGGANDLWNDFMINWKLCDGAGIRTCDLWIYSQTHYRVRYVARLQRMWKCCDWLGIFTTVNTVQIMSSRPVFWIWAWSDGKGRNFSGKYKRGLDKRGKLLFFFFIFKKETIFICFRVCFPAHEAPSEIEVYPNINNLLSFCSHHENMPL